jgi:hypothetical protein
MASATLLFTFRTIPRVPCLLLSSSLDWGEENTNIDGLYVHGPLNFIKYGNWKPSFIVVGIQPCFGWPGNNFTNPMLQYLVSNAAFHINPYKITLTGLSAGANATFAYILQPNAPVKLAAAIAFSYAVSGSCLSNPTDYWSNYLCAADEPWHYLPYWGLCGTGDSFLWKTEGAL